MNTANEEDFHPAKTRKGSVLNCTGRSREPHALRIRIEEIDDTTVVVATDLDTNERIYLGITRVGGARYFLMYRGEAFGKVEIMPEEELVAAE